MAGALIVTAELGRDDFAWLDGVRRSHYPADRNQVPAHLTMFHALPPSSESEIRSRLAGFGRSTRPKAWIDGLLDLSGGVAYRVVSDDLDRIRRELSGDLYGLLSAQDAGGWRPHITVQNKVAPKIARALKTELESGFVRRPLTISGLGLHRYLGGPWETLGVFSFSGD